IVLNYLFFFQAEDGIRDFHVTGVQTCALPILPTAIAPNWQCSRGHWHREADPLHLPVFLWSWYPYRSVSIKLTYCSFICLFFSRSEERRVGKEFRSCGSCDVCNI